jgi:hypothetical protein
VYDFAAARAVAEGIPGWLMPNEAEALYRLGYDARGNVVEVGSYFGKSTYLIARGMADAGRDDRRLVSIDVHYRGVDADTGRAQVFAEDAPSFLLRTMREQQLDHLVMHLVGWSHVAVTYLDFANVEAVFIDGGHEYEDVCRDFLAVRGRVRAGTRSLFHDYNPEFPGVVRAVDEHVRTDPGFEFLALTHSLFDCRMRTGVAASEDASVAALVQRAETAERGESRLRAALESEQAAHRALRIAYDELRESTSWRMTAPLRWGMDRLRGR